MIMYVPTDYCYQANEALEESEDLRGFVNFLLAFRVRTQCNVWLVEEDLLKHNALVDKITYHLTELPSY